MSRILIIGDQPLSREIGAGLSAADMPVEYAAGHADALQRLRIRSFGVVITSSDSEVAEDLALLGGDACHPARSEVHHSGPTTVRPTK